MKYLPIVLLILFFGCRKEVVKQPIKDVPEHYQIEGVYNSTTGMYLHILCDSCRKSIEKFWEQRLVTKWTDASKATRGYNFTITPHNEKKPD
jgi:hypothetical protein